MMKDTIVFAFGRFNPPTTGHEKIIEKVAAVARKEKADFMIFPSQSQNARKDPLDFNTKVKFMKKMFPKYSRNIIKNTKIKTAFNVASLLQDMGYKKCIMVVGGDRVTEFDTTLNKYNGKIGRHGFYDFDGGIQVVSAGERDPDAEGVTGMSASKMRAAAVANDYDSFKNGLPKSFKNGEDLFSAVRSAMKVEGMMKEMFEAEILALHDFMDTKIPELIEDLEEDELVSFMKETFDLPLNYEKKESVLEPFMEVGFSSFLGQKTLKKAMANTLYTKEYQKAAEILKKLLDRKSKESSGRGLKHSVLYYANQIAKSFKHVDTRLLARMVEDLDFSNPKVKKELEDIAKELDDGDFKKRYGDEWMQVKMATATNILKKKYGEKVEEKEVKIPLELLKLYNKGMQLPAGSPAHKKVLKQIQDLRKKLNISEEEEMRFYHDFIEEEVTPKQVNDLEKFADKLLKKFNIDVTFTRHFVDRMNDPRNSPEIKVSELQRLFKKIQKNKGKNILSNPDIEAVLKDMSTDLNLPVVINYRDGEFEIVNKTIMRKKNFGTSSKVLKYEDFMNNLKP